VQCRRYTTPRLPNEGGQGVAAAFVHGTFAGYNNYTPGCETSKDHPAPCSYYTAQPNLLGAKSLLWRSGAPVWLQGLGIYDNWFYTLDYAALNSSTPGPTVPHDWACASGCMAQINYDLSRCEAFYGDKECGRCAEVKKDWSTEVTSNCSDSDFDYEIDVSDTEQGWYCWCHNHTKCVDQDSSYPDGFQCVKC